LKADNHENAIQYATNAVLFAFQVYHIQFWLGLHPRHYWGSIQHWYCLAVTRKEQKELRGFKWGRECRRDSGGW